MDVTHSDNNGDSKKTKTPFDPIECGKCYFDLGIHYQKKNEYELMKKYLLMAIEFDNIDAMYTLGTYYDDIGNENLMCKYYLMAIKTGNLISKKNTKNDNKKLEKYKLYPSGYINSLIDLSTYYSKKNNHRLMIKYLLIAVKLDNIDAMYCLGLYYQKSGRYELMKKYYKMASELGDVESMYALGIYYENSGFYDLMKKYYKMAIKLNNIDATYSLGLYYENIGNHDKMKKYYLKGIKLGDYESMYRLGFHYGNIRKYDKMIKYYSMASELGYNIAISELVNYCKMKKENYRPVKVANLSWISSLSNKQSTNICNSIGTSLRQ